MKIQNSGEQTSELKLSYTEPHHLELDHAEIGRLGRVFVDEPSYVARLHGCTIAVDEESGLGYLKPSASLPEGKLHRSAQAGPSTMSEAMSTQDRYIDARLAGIESKLDARMEAMQRFQEQAEARMDRQTRESETRLADLYAKTEARMDVLHADNKGLRVHLWAAVLTAVLGFAGVAALMQSTVVEQGAWLRDSVNRIEQRIETPQQVSPVVTPAQQPADAEQTPSQPEQQAPVE